MNELMQNKIQEWMVSEMTGARTPELIPPFTKSISEVGKQNNIFFLSFNKTELEVVKNALQEALLSPGTRAFALPNEYTINFKHIDRWIIKAILAQLELKGV